MPEDANVILNEFYDIKDDQEKLKAFIETHKDNIEAEPIIKIANQALDNISPTPNKPKPKVLEKEQPKKEATTFRHTVIETESSNPLMQYFRPPGAYVVLPSKGNFYKQKPELSVIGEVLVRPMTAKDELQFKSPDILMNGDSLLSVISSCVPGIANPKEIPGPDFSVIMLAIRSATYGKELTYSGVCDKCQEETEFNVDIDLLLETQISELKEEYTVEAGKLKVYVKPYDVYCQTRSSIANFEQAAITNNIISNEELSQAEKASEFSKSFNKITEITYELVLQSILKVATPNEDIDAIHDIAEWLYLVDRKTFELIRDKILEATNDGFNGNVTYNCGKCNKENSTFISFDPTTFFA
tara:strand:+ start:3630 stop:4700 length:1071 start_codon:yes stop_codon:yes gene_type:complete